MNKQMSKQDRQGVRTASDIERKYNLGDISKNQESGSKQQIQIQQLNQNLANFMATTNARLDELGENDKMWFYSGVPTLENHPAIDWTTGELKAKHIGDMYYDVDSGDMYLFKNTEGVYAWDSCFGGGVDYDTAYNDGYGKGYTDGETTGYEKGVEEGKFFLNKIYGYAELFNGTTFPDGYELEFNLNNAHSTNIVGAFANIKGLKSIKLTGGNGKVCNCTNLFSSISTVETIDISELNIKLGNCTNIFLNDNALKIIIGELDLTDCTNTLNFFVGCSALEEVRFKAETVKISIRLVSTKLTPESVQSIVDGLAIVETQQTLTLPKSIILTDEQKATISSKNWTLVQQ